MRVALIALALAAAVAAVGGSNARAISIVQANLPDAFVGSPYSFQLEGDDGCPASYHFKLSSGRLPAGMAVEDKGLIDGTPTEAGAFQFYVDLSDECVGDSRTQRQFSLNVQPRLVVATTALAPARLGAPYSVQLTAAGGGSQTWSVADGAVPPGLTLGAEGLLSGTPTSSGSFAFTVKVADAARVATQPLTLVVAAPLSLAPPAVAAAEVGVSFSAAPPRLAGGVAPFTWSLQGGSLPAGLAVDASTGAISGVPRAAGVFHVRVAVASSDGTDAGVDVTVRVAARLAVASLRLPAARVGGAYSARLAARGGVAPVRWTLAGGARPAGLRLSPAGILTGRPVTAGSTAFVVKATDRLGATASRRLVLTVSAS